MKSTLAGVVFTFAIVSSPVAQETKSRGTAAVAPSTNAGCPARNPGVKFRVAYAHVFIEPPRGPTLSLRVSIRATGKNSPDLLQGVGCALSAKYHNERNWQALVFSDYEAAKRYESPEPGQSEPPQYLGACAFYQDGGLIDLPKSEVMCSDTTAPSN
jgi:hypothetical protein